MLQRGKENKMRKKAEMSAALLTKEQNLAIREEVKNAL